MAAVIGIGFDRPPHGTQMHARRILLIGGTGQLGAEIRRDADTFGFDVHSPDSKSLDITDDDSLKTAIAEFKPAAVINTAAYHVVPDCEREPLRAMAVNCQAVNRLALVCKAAGAAFVTYSTDYVFDGAKGTPYVENDPPNPLQFYGISKLAGEFAALNYYGDKTIVIRTSFLYGGKAGSSQKKGNFVLNILRQAQHTATIEVSSDQTVSPTFAGDLSKATLELLRGGTVCGIYHLANEGFCRLSDFAATILTLAGSDTVVIPVDRSQSVHSVRRPAFTALHNTRAKSHGVELPPWSTALAAYIRSLGDSPA